MHIFIPVFFRARLGGLQAHVAANAKALMAAGHSCTVMCPPGPFAHELRSLGAEVIEESYADLEAAGERGIALPRLDLVHAHPFEARRVGLHVARERKVPFVLTLHALYDDSLIEYAHELDLLITVADSIRDYVVRAGFPFPERLVTIPNGYAPRRFHPRRSGRVSVRPLGGAKVSAGACSPLVLVVTRLDENKGKLVEAVLDAWHEQQSSARADLCWLVAGDGELRGRVEEAARRLNDTVGRPVAELLGWCLPSQLAELYRGVDVVVGPGRCALEAMASGTLAIAAANNGYLGLVDQSRWQLALYSNFDGDGTSRTCYQPGRLLADVRIATQSLDRSQLRDRCLRWVELLKQPRLDRIYTRHLELLVSGKPAPKPAPAWTQRECPALDFQHSESGKPIWVWTGRSGEVVYSEPVRKELRIDVDLGADQKSYLIMGAKGFDQPSLFPHVTLIPGHALQLRVLIDGDLGAVHVQCWVIQYDASKRIGHTVKNLVPGENVVEFLGLHGTHSFRVALRFAGRGTVRLGSLALFFRSTD